MSRGDMSFADVRARLNLFAVLPNLEDVVSGDEEMRALVSDTRIVVRFNVTAGPKAWVRLADGVCTVGQGLGPEKQAAGGPVTVGDPAATAEAAGAAAPPAAVPSVVLLFTSSGHLNKLFDGTSQPIPVWGFNHLRFLQGPFSELTDRMAYYLAPTEELLEHPGYLAMNTRLTLNTAACAVPQLLAADPDCMPLRHGLAHGTIVLKVEPDGPAVSLVCGASGVLPVKGELPHPSALVLLPSLRVANDFLNGKLDTFAAVARGDIAIWGRIGLVDTLGLVLDRVPRYLAPAGEAGPAPAPSAATAATG
jgi:hypothetical protein